MDRTCGICEDAPYLLMMKDESGNQHGRLRVVSRAENRVSSSGRSSAAWTCLCACGRQTVVTGSNLCNGSVQSCGCLSRDQTRKRSLRHGRSGTPEHRAWKGMIQRCTNTNAVNFRDYGGRGIKVCARWRNSFENFLADMGDRPSPQHSLDRYPNNDGDYEPTNCRWATKTQQSFNRRPMPGRGRRRLKAIGAIAWREMLSAVKPMRIRLT
jgi:hypothetical protein